MINFSEDLTSKLETAIANVTKVHLIRTSKHEGLIRARLIGTAMSSAPVLTFLDAHVECFEGIFFQFSYVSLNMRAENFVGV